MEELESGILNSGEECIQAIATLLHQDQDPV